MQEINWGLIKNLDIETDSWQIQKPCVFVHVRLIFF